MQSAENVERNSSIPLSIFPRLKLWNPSPNERRTETEEINNALVNETRASRRAREVANERAYASLAATPSGEVKTLLLFHPSFYSPLPHLSLSLSRSFLYTNGYFIQRHSTRASRGRLISQSHCIKPEACIKQPEGPACFLEATTAEGKTRGGWTGR